RNVCHPGSSHAGQDWGIWPARDPQKGRCDAAGVCCAGQSAARGLVRVRAHARMRSTIIPPNWRGGSTPDTSEEHPMEQAGLENLVLDNREDGLFRVHRSAFTDPQIMALEQRRVFEQCWLYA